MTTPVHRVKLPYGRRLPNMRERLPGGVGFTQLLTRWRAGDRGVEGELVNEFYPLMKDIASAQLRGQRSDLLQTTELANEAYIRVSEISSVDWRDRRHFMAIVATVIRRLMVDMMRERIAQKRGGSAFMISLDDEGLNANALADSGELVDWGMMERALSALEAEDALAARVTELKVLVGMTTEDIAEEMGSSVATVGRQWRFAKAFLADHLSDSRGLV